MKSPLPRFNFERNKFQFGEPLLTPPLPQQQPPTADSPGVRGGEAPSTQQSLPPPGQSPPIGVSHQPPPHGPCQQQLQHPQSSPSPHPLTTPSPPLPVPQHQAPASVPTVDLNFNHVVKQENVSGGLSPCSQGGPSPCSQGGTFKQPTDFPPHQQQRKQDLHSYLVEKK